MLCQPILFCRESTLSCFCRLVYNSGRLCNAQHTKLVGVLKVVRILYVSSICKDERMLAVMVSCAHIWEHDMSIGDLM